MGDRKKNIMDAISCLDIRLGNQFKSVSSLIETEPWGFESDKMFINAAVMYELELREGYNAEAEGLMILEICKDIESMLGREGNPEYDADGKRIYCPRPIDIDILFLGKNRIDCHELTVPHKFMSQRDFVMTPLEEIVSDEIRNEFRDIF